MESFKRNEKGFTLIELIVVMIIVGILVLLATPRFLRYVEKSRYTKIINDTKVVETVSLPEMVKNEMKLPRGTETGKADLEGEIKDRRAYAKDGLILMEDDAFLPLVGKISEMTGEEALDRFYKLDKKDFVKSETRTKLKGDFFIDKEGYVVYIEGKGKIAKGEEAEKHTYKIELKHISLETGREIKTDTITKDLAEHVSLSKYSFDEIKAVEEDPVNDYKFVKMGIEGVGQAGGRIKVSDLSKTGNNIIKVEYGIKLLTADEKQIKRKSNTGECLKVGKYRYQVLKGVDDGAVKLEDREYKVLGFASDAEDGNIENGNPIYGEDYKKTDRIGVYKIFDPDTIESETPQEIDSPNLLKVTEIDSYAFSGRSILGGLDIRSIVMPDTVVKIGMGSFNIGYRYTLDYETDLLYGEEVKVDFSNLSSLEEIGMGSFMGNNMTGELDLSSLVNLRVIGERAFEGNEFDAGIKFDGLINLERIEYNAFFDSKLKGELDLSPLVNLERIGKWAFSSNEFDAGIKFDGLTNLKIIEDSAFSSAGLEGELDLSPLVNLERIGKWAFAGNYSEINGLSVKFDGLTNLKTIGEYAFYSSSLVGELDLSPLINLEKIENSAFRNNRLESFDLTGLDKSIKIEVGTFNENYFLNKIRIDEKMLTEKWDLVMDSNLEKPVFSRGFQEFYEANNRLGGEYIYTGDYANFTWDYLPF